MTIPAKLPALTVLDECKRVIEAYNINGFHFGLLGRIDEAMRPIVYVGCLSDDDIAALDMTPGPVIMQSIRQPDAGATPRTDKLQNDHIEFMVPAFTALTEYRDLARQLERELAALSAPAGSRGWMPADPECERVKWIDPAGYDFIGIVIQDSENAFKRKRYVLPLPTAPEEK